MHDNLFFSYLQKYLQQFIDDNSIRSMDIVISFLSNNR